MTVSRIDPVVAQCATCGVEYDLSALPGVCPICADERQYLPADGAQRWVEPGQFPDARLSVEQAEPAVQWIHQHNVPGIGQTPLLVTCPTGNVLIEVPAHIDEDAVRQVQHLGGVQAIIASHPHMYGLQSQWSEAFGQCPVFVSRADEQWLGRRPANTIVWEDTIEVLPGMVASQPGGHFPGSAVMHWTGHDGKGVLFTGDTISPVLAQGWVGFMRSYPNLIPLSGAVVRRIAEHVARHDFDRLYGNFGARVPAGARDAVLRSAERHAAWSEGRFDHLT